MRVMVCGGAGYIGSHTCVALCERGHDVAVVDNFSHSTPEALQRLEALIGRSLDAHCVDLRDGAALSALFARHRYDAVVHLAALKSSSDARARPLAYFDNNIAGTIALLRTMREAGVGKLVHGSSAAIYGDAASGAVSEQAPPICDDPYARAVAFVEQLIGEVCAADPGLRAITLRHFDPVGAHPSGRIGDAIGCAANDTLQAICQVASGLRESVPIYGDDWPTRDGTCARDYLHVVDAARAYADAVEALSDDAREAEDGHAVLNIGSGRSVGALEALRAFEAASGRRIPYRILARRIGDVAELHADPQHAARWLGWRAELGVDAICRDVWRWQSMRATTQTDAPAYVADAAPK
ncbi:MAG: UDP-glucose 4-epimerase GalE [Lysobacter sp.]|nr:UDP-glucose 4-epimerase GalE [Lysobacter sp.]